MKGIVRVHRTVCARRSGFPGASPRYGGSSFRFLRIIPEKDHFSKNHSKRELDGKGLYFIGLLFPYGIAFSSLFDHHYPAPDGDDYRNQYR